MATSLIPVGLLEQLSAGSLSYFDYVILAAALVAGTRSLGKGRFWNKPDPNLYKLFERPQLLNGQKSEVIKESRNIGQRLEESGRDLVIFWGSQSGTAEGFAHRLAKDLYQRLRLKSLVLDLDDYDHDTTSSIPESKFAVFIVSTYGEGEPSDNAITFFKWLQTPSTGPLSNLKYAAFGLGNSNYRLFNKAVDDVVTELESRKAVALLPTSRADEATRTTEEDFVEWKATFVAAVASRYGLTECEPEYEQTLKIEELPSSNLNKEQISTPVPTKSSAAISALVNVPVKMRKSLIVDGSSSRQSVHLEIDISAHPEVKYKTGDHILIWARNSNEEVDRLLTVLRLKEKKDTALGIQSVDGDNSKLKLPSKCSINSLFQKHLEISAPVKRETLVSLAQYTNSITAKSWLQNIARNKTAFTDLQAQNHITLARLLELAQTFDTQADWSTLPLSLIVESLPLMSPRYYSISSSSIISPRRVAITVSVKPTPLASNSETLIPGLASTYLSTMPLPTESEAATRQLSSEIRQIPVQIRRSTFKLPFSASTPIIMVAAGTGIAPFRAFIQQRARLAAASGGPQSVGHMTLFFGCQNPDRDFLYRDELLELQHSEALKGKLDIVTAFSRVEKSPERRYVQHRVRERAEQVCKEMVKDGACLYICGAVKMAKEVGEVIGEQLKESQDWNDAKFAAWRNEKKRTKRWHEDVWG